MNLPKKVLNHGLLLLVAILPFNIFAVVWANHLVRHLYIWSAIVYLIVVVLGICSLALIIFDKNLLTTLIKPAYNKLAIGYILLTTIYLFVQGLTMTALVGYALDVGFVYIFLIAQAAGYYQPKIINKLAKIVLITGMILSVIAILQIFVLPHDMLTYFGYDRSGVNTSGVPPASHTVAAGSSLYRAQATMRGPNVFGAFLLLPIFIVCYRYIRSKDKKYLILFMIMALALALTYARSALIGIVAALLSLAILDTRTRAHIREVFTKNIRLIVGIGVALVLTLVVVLPLVWPTHQFQALILHNNQSVARTQSTEAHGQLSLRAAKQVVTTPLGLGLGQAGPSSALNHPDKANIAEDNYLQIGQELGWLGLILFVALILSVIGQLWTAKHQLYVTAILLAFIAVTVANLMLHIWTDETVSMTLWALAGVAIAPTAGKRPSRLS